MAEENITTKFVADVSDLKAGISEANYQIKLANATFKKETAGLDNYADSVDGIKAKLDQLGKVLEAGEKKVGIYRDRIKKNEETFDSNSKKIDALKSALQKMADDGLDRSDKKFKEYDDALKKATKSQENISKEVDNLKITLLNQESAVERTKKEIQNYEKELENAESGNKNLSDEVKKTSDTAEKSTGGFTIMKGAISDLVSKGIQFGIDKLKEFAGGLIDAAAQLKAESSQFSQTFGDSSSDAKEAIKRVADSTGIISTRLNKSASGIFAFAKASGADTPQAMELMETSIMAAADTAAYYDRSLEDSTDTLQSFLKGNYANDAALGVSATEFTRNAEATELFGKKFNDLNEIQKQQTLLQMVVDAQKASGAFGQAAREADGWENVQGNLNETWRQFKGEIGTAFLEEIIPLVQELTDKFTKWRESVDWDEVREKIKNALNKIIDFGKWVYKNAKPLTVLTVGLFSAFAFVKIVNGVSNAVGALEKFGGAMAGFFTSPVGLATLAVGALVAGGVALIEWFEEEEPVIKSSKDTQAEWTKAKEDAKNAEDRYIDAVDREEQTLKDLQEIETQSGISGEELYEKVKNGTTCYENLDDQQKEVYKRYKEHVEAQEEVQNSIDDLNAKKDEEMQKEWEHELSLAKEGDSYDDFKEKVIKAYEDGSLSSEQARDLIEKATSEMSSSTAKAFTDDIPNSIKDGLDPEHYKTSQEKFKESFKSVCDWIVTEFKKAWFEIKEKAKTIWDGITKAWDWLTGSGTDIDAKNAWKAFSKSPKMATGGVLKKGQVGILEGDGAEAVVPLEKNKYWIKQVAKEMLGKMGQYGNTSNYGNNYKNQNDIVINQTNNYAQAHTAYEIYKSKQEMTNAVKLAVRGAR